MSTIGCHKCGKHPNHPDKGMQTYKVFLCSECKTVTCNNHLIGLAGNVCPKCNSTSLVCTATRTDKPKDTLTNKAVPEKKVPEKTVPVAPASAGGFGGRAAPQLNKSVSAGDISFTPETPASIAISGRPISQEFVQSMVDKDGNKLASRAAIPIIESPQSGDTKPKQSAPLAISQNAPAPEQPKAKELPDPASLSGAVYADACFRPVVDDRLHGLNEMLQTIAKQLEPGKNLKIVVLALEFNDIQPYLNELNGLLQKYTFVRLAVGYGPRQAADGGLDFEALTQFVNATPQVIALDAGLDLHFAAYTKNAQVQLLQKQIELANHLGKPVFLTSVKADHVLLEAIHQPVKGVYCSPLSGDEAFELCKKHNLWVCTRSEITQPGQDSYRTQLAKIPTGKVLLGTGSNLVVPAGANKMENSPLYTDEIARVLMKIYHYQKLETVYGQCYKNLYGLLMGL